MISRTDALHTAPPGEAGFTLLEMVVVLAIVGILLGVVLERGPLRSDTLAFSAARAKVLQVMRGAQTTAGLTGRGMTVLAVPASGDLITVGGGSPQTSHIGGKARLVSPAGEGVALSWRFSPDGAVSGPPLAVVLGRHVALVQFSAVSGRVTVDER